MSQFLRYDISLEQNVPNFIAGLIMEEIAGQEYGESVKTPEKTSNRTTGNRRNTSSQNPGRTSGDHSPTDITPPTKQTPLCLRETHREKGSQAFSKTVATAKGSYWPTFGGFEETNI